MRNFFVAGDCDCGCVGEAIAPTDVATRRQNRKLAWLRLARKSLMNAVLI
jgi:hypothetical protein